MRLVIDFFACQTASRFRGIGRYTHSLARAMVETARSHHMIALANANFPDSYEELRREFTRLLPAGSFLPYQSIDIDPTRGEKDRRFEVASTLVRHAYESLSPDVILYPSIFEGWGENGVVPLPENGFPSALKSVIVYDFVPYIFADRFLNADPYFKEFYYRRLEVLKEFDLLLAISESTRQDTIKYLGLPPDRVVNISAAVSPDFQKKEFTGLEVEELLRRFGIEKPFVFYTGNVEYHKNMEKALKAFSQLPDEVRRNHQFVLTHTGDETAFRKRLRSFGIDDHEVVITGHISDQDLIALYNCCKLYIFPSLYEGFGLPILEAMACGAPVICGNNSSLPEVMGREDAMFDASSEQSIANALHHALTDEAFLQNLSKYGLERVKEFTWEKTAQKAWTAIEEALAKKKRNGLVRVSKPDTKAKLRVAYVSPLPPERSGIADYSADLLPYLSHYVDVDLFVEPGQKPKGRFINKKSKVYPWTDLMKRQGDYDTVIYQVGNSKYHRHMFQLIRDVPGIVVLHDFYLSHIREYIYSTHFLSNPGGNFLDEVGEIHGLFGMVDFIQRGLNKAIWDWPVNWNVLKYARKIIVHSEFQNTLIRKFYGRGWYPQTEVIKQLHKTERILSKQEKRLSKQRLGIDPESFTFCSFGFLNPTKLNQLTIEAFAKYLSTDERATLVFVGESEKGDFEIRIQELCRQLGLLDRVKFTGFVDNNIYRDYLQVADAAIQLRTNSRGETSRAVLDCMAFGIPTIVNAHGSLTDYHDGDVIKLEEYPQADELLQAMVRLRQDTEYREMVGQNARNAIEQCHHPEQIAAAYYNVIKDAVQTRDSALFAPLVDAVARLDSDSIREILPSVSAVAAANMSLRNQPRILIDVTNIAYLDLRTGIQRVVKNIIRGFYSIFDPSNHVELIRIQEGKLYRAARFAERLFDLPETSLGNESPIYIQPGDTLFMLDTSWNLYDQFVPVFDQVRKAGGRIYTMLYDMIPAKFPALCTGPTVEYFKIWIDQAIVESDEMICISKAVISDVEEYIREKLPHLTRRCDLSYIHLGADIPLVREESAVRDEVLSMIRVKDSPLFLMVGTLEPRKGHTFALDAFEFLWKQGRNDRLCIIGKIGWNVEDLEQRIRNHPELRKRLFFIENATDAEINLCYSAGTALVAPSIAEGFGLPIIEAALHQIPALVSDIPVFHEVGGEGALYFSLDTPVCLAEAVQEIASKTREERVGLSKKIKYLSWNESADWVRSILEKKRAPDGVI